jgi:hypothetical protein
MKNVLLLIGVVLRSRIIPRKKWRAIPVIWEVIRLTWCATGAALISGFMVRHKLAPEGF